MVGCTPKKATDDMGVEPPDMSSETLDMSAQTADLARDPDSGASPPDLVSAIDSSMGSGLLPPPSSFSWYGEINARDTMDGGENAQLGSASFVQVAAGAALGTATSVGPCVVFNLTGITANDGNLGPIDINDAVGTLELTCKGSGCDGDRPTNATMWLPGDVLTFKADAGTFGGFAVSLTMPDVASFVPAGASGYQMRTVDLPLSWTGGTKSIVARITSQSATVSTQMVCTFPAASQQGIVPSAALALMPAGAYVLEFSVTNTVSFNAGGAYLTVGATSDNGSLLNIAYLQLN